MRHLLILLLAVGCGADPSEPSPSGSPDVGSPSDVQFVFATPDDGPDLTAGPDIPDVPDAAPAPDVGPDVPPIPDVGPDIPDTSIPDTSAPDTSAPDTTIPDTAVPDTGPDVPDTGPDVPDTGPPPECDASTPCPAGEQCVAGDCQPCTTNAACGPTCAACGGPTPTCQGATCVCSPTSCGAGAWCNAGACATCGDDPQHCGSACATCAGNKPACSGGKCVCTDTSCPAGQWCAPSGACTSCDDAAHCGPKCLPCGGGQPYCVSGACQACVTNAHCAAGQWCSGGSCVACGPSDPAHCGPTCAVCTSSEQCTEGQCVPKPCAAQGCATDVAPDAKTCAKARVVGRTNAQTGFLVMGDTTGGGNNDDLPSQLFGPSDCWDAKYDHFYRIWLFTGESISVTASPMDLDFNIMLKLYQGLVCDSEQTLIGCANDKGDEQAETYTHVATQDGWVTIVVDGPLAASDEWDYGKYSIHVKLTCAQGDCCCGP